MRAHPPRVPCPSSARRRTRSCLPTCRTRATTTRRFRSDQPFTTSPSPSRLPSRFAGSRSRTRYLSVSTSISVPSPPSRSCSRAHHCHRPLAASPQERFQRLQVQCSAVLREKTATQSQIEAMTQAAAERSGVSEEADMLRAQVEQLRVELEAANEELTHRPAGGESNNSMQVEALTSELGPRPVLDRPAVAVAGALCDCVVLVRVRLVCCDSARWRRGSTAHSAVLCDGNVSLSTPILHSKK